MTQIMLDDFLPPGKHQEITDDWKITLEKKRQARARLLELREQRLPQPEQIEKIVIHNPGLPLNLPVKPQNLFAIMSLNGTQYKVSLNL